MSIYDFPQYYDLVFGSDCKTELHFLVRCFETHAHCPVVRVFEPACGTGRLLFRLSKTGYEMSGLDLNAKSVAYCNARLSRMKCSGSAFIGDMTDFRLPRKVEAAYNLINSFRHLTSESAARTHLKCVANSLHVGGLYVVGLHLTPTRGRPTQDEGWLAQRGRLVIESKMWLIRSDRRRRWERHGLAFDVWTPNRRFRLVDELVFRTYTAPQFDRLLRSVPEFEVAATYDFWHDFDRPIDVGPATEDVIFVLRKR